MIMDEKSEDIEKNNYLYGWVCPRCGNVYAIWVAGCFRCNQPKFVSTNTTDEIIGEIIYKGKGKPFIYLEDRQTLSTNAETDKSNESEG